MTFPSLDEQRTAFDEVRDSIDLELRNTGFEEILQRFDIDTSVGRLIVAKDFQYSSQAATLDRDLDPLAQRLETEYLVGCAVETPTSRSFGCIWVSSALMGEGQTANPDIPELTYIQLAVVEAAVSRLMRQKPRMPYLTKSLKRIDPAGD